MDAHTHRHTQRERLIKIHRGPHTNTMLNQKKKDTTETNTTRDTPKKTQKEILTKKTIKTLKITAPHTHTHIATPHPHPPTHADPHTRRPHKDKHIYIEGDIHRHSKT
jgi:hypothetical protein